MSELVYSFEMRETMFLETNFNVMALFVIIMTHVDASAIVIERPSTRGIKPLVQLKGLLGLAMLATLFFVNRNVIMSFLWISIKKLICRKGIMSMILDKTGV